MRILALWIALALGAGSALAQSWPQKPIIALARANPGKYSFAHSGTGSGQHLSGELLKKMAGIQMLHVPCKGGAPAVQDFCRNQTVGSDKARAIMRALCRCISNTSIPNNLLR